jgi:hypothetical protein
MTSSGIDPATFGLVALPLALYLYCTVSKSKMTHNWERIWKDTNMVLIEIVSCCMPTGTEENHEKSERIQDASP